MVGYWIERFPITCLFGLSNNCIEMVDKKIVILVTFSSHRSVYYNWQTILVDADLDTGTGNTSGFGRGAVFVIVRSELLFFSFLVLVFNCNRRVNLKSLKVSHVRAIRLCPYLFYAVLICYRKQFYVLLNRCFRVNKNQQVICIIYWTICLVVRDVQLVKF